MKVVITLDSVLKAKGMSQRELSRLASIRAPSINEMFHNQTVQIPLNNLAKICEVLDCEITDILKLEKEI